MTDASNNVVSAVSPNAFAFVYRSRQVKVATVSANGLVSPVSRGGYSILVGNNRAVNVDIPSGANSGTEGVFCELQVTVLP